MMRYLLFFTILSILTGLAGCASSSSSTDDQKQKASFKTKVIPTNFSMGGGGLAEEVTVYYQAHATCEAASCIPGKVNLSFLVKPGSNDLYLNERSLSLKTDDSTYSWHRYEWTSIYESPPVRGRIIGVFISLDELSEIAESPNVTGKLSRNGFKWTYENRKPLRTFLQNMRSQNGKKNEK